MEAGLLGASFGFSRVLAGHCRLGLDRRRWNSGEKVVDFARVGGLVDVGLHMKLQFDFGNHLDCLLKWSSILDWSSCWSFQKEDHQVLFAAALKHELLLLLSAQTLNLQFLTSSFYLLTFELFLHHDFEQELFLLF